ncbi:MAG: hypothetical protein Kow00124_21300 [Anaerolineae bacterium]
MSENLSPADRDRPPSRSVVERPPAAGASPSPLGVFVLALLLLALLAGGVGGFMLGRSYERSLFAEDHLAFLLGARLVDDEGYVILKDVVSGGPAANAGLVEGEVIERIGAERLEDAAQGRSILAGFSSGDSVLLTVRRFPRVEQYTVVLGSYAPPVVILPPDPPLPPTMPPVVVPGQMQEARLGVYYRMIRPEDNLSASEGALLILLDDYAAVAGLQVGDIITAVDGVSLTQSMTLEQALDRYSAGERVRLAINRAGETFSLRVTLRSR